MADDPLANPYERRKTVADELAQRIAAIVDQEIPDVARIVGPRVRLTRQLDRLPGNLGFALRRPDGHLGNRAAIGITAGRFHLGVDGIFFQNLIDGAQLCKDAIPIGVVQFAQALQDRA